MKTDNIPSTSYGILQQYQLESSLDAAAEQVRNLGYAIIASGYTESDLQGISREFNICREHYVETYTTPKLRSLNEINTIRSPLTHGGEEFLRLALNKKLLSILTKLIQGKFILNQQNGLINLPQEPYNQAAWHRDLPYQHFVSSKPIAINALFCIDDFTIDNGATFVIPASHKFEDFPSQNYIQKNAIQIEAKAGSFILLDSMVFHAGGYNQTQSVRRAVNQLFNIPFFKQQINIPMNMNSVNLSPEEKDILGFSFTEPSSIPDYLSNRISTDY